MDNTTENLDVIEATTELTVSDIKTLDFIVDTCLTANMFADVSTSIVQDLSTKLKQLIETLDKAS
jgi:hypothetical protein